MNDLHTIGVGCLVWLAVMVILAAWSKRDKGNPPCDPAAAADHAQAQVLARYADTQTRQRSENLLCTLQATIGDDV